MTGERIELLSRLAKCHPLFFALFLFAELELAPELVHGLADGAVFNELVLVFGHD